MSYLREGTQQISEGIDGIRLMSNEALEITIALVIFSPFILGLVWLVWGMCREEHLYIKQWHKHKRYELDKFTRDLEAESERERIKNNVEKLLRMGREGGVLIAADGTEYRV